MEDKPLVSIAINNYNYARFLGEAIDSALNQTYPHTEVIVVDDGSTDNSREIIASYGDKIIPLLKENGGQASAFNAGFAASKGDIICFLDADDMFLPEKAAEIVDAFGSSPDLGWCFHALKWVDDNGKPLNPKNSHEGESISKNGFPKREYDLRADIKKGKLKNKLAHLPSTTALCFSRSLLQQILPMPEAKRIGLNDGYLEFTAIGLSKGLMLDKELALYRVHGSNAYSMRNDRQKVQARIGTITGYWLRVKFPDFSKFANNLVGTGLGMYWRAGGVEEEYRELVKNHLASVTLPEKVEIYARAAFNYLKNTTF
ncbi:glycosyltransferase family 2 protein [Argonema galeatum]|uniref:glycosyltransferase family 2 protein n=1 Tax=Argonema galeatum TaxID=2942762 RepID=UPI002012585C|nr:glycosyltransferase [Argonema galeatum]MCL1463447.1 glycosyltransferase [Argonema galeatum A003/A1]